MENAATERITTCIDELTADLLVQEDVSASRERWASSLLQLAQFAASAGNTELASMAKSTAEVLQRPNSMADEELSRTLENSLALMREAAAATNAPPTPAAPAVVSIAEDPELIADFVLESREHLQNIETQLLSLEQDVEQTEALHSIFRSYHTIKGLAGFLELPLIQEVAHEVETVLDHARQGTYRLTPHSFDVILEARDYIGAWLRYLDGPRKSPCPDNLRVNSDLVARISSLLHPPERTPQAAEQPASGIVPPPLAPGSTPTPAPTTTVALTPVASPPAAPTESRQTQSIRETTRSVKVDTAKLDYLVDMVGEMVIAQSMVRHDPSLTQTQSPTLARNLSQLVRITDEVQRTAMSMRMVPIGPLFQKMARLVRDLSRKIGKQIQFESEGEEVELDRNIVEELADPLMHMVRNSVDHGIETAEMRAASGKPETARVTLRAFHRSGQIVIQVADDGRGIDRDKVLAKARAKELIAPNAVLTDAECLNLIFHPGFSTAEQISDVSGRGVGLDVVKKQIQKLRGSVDIESKPLQGTTFSLRLPLTLAIIEGLVVAVGRERYIIPLASVKEMLRPTEDMVTSVENRAEVVSIRNRLLPLMRLYERFGTEPRSTEPTEGVLIVTDLDGASFCLMVDELIGKQEVVIKSLGPVFASSSGLAGGAILGDGQVGLILDLASLFGGRNDA